VAELLAEQVEAANLILVKKVDLAEKEEVKVASAVARSLNDKAQVGQVELGRASPMYEVEEPYEDPNCNNPSHSHLHSRDAHSNNPPNGQQSLLYKIKSGFQSYVIYKVSIVS
jgi:G3E family GTPase